MTSEFFEAMRGLTYDDFEGASGVDALFGTGLSDCAHDPVIHSNIEIEGAKS